MSTEHRAGSASGGDALPDRAGRPGAPLWRGSREEPAAREKTAAVRGPPELRHNFLCLSSGTTGLHRAKTGGGCLCLPVPFLSRWRQGRSFSGAGEEGGRRAGSRRCAFAEGLG